MLSVPVLHLGPQLAQGRRIFRVATQQHRTVLPRWRVPIVQLRNNSHRLEPPARTFRRLADNDHGLPAVIPRSLTAGSFDVR